MQAEMVLEMLPSIQYAMLCYSYNRLDRYIGYGNTEPHCDCYECYFDAIGAASDLFVVHYSECYEQHCLYVSFESMMEYYRLCRTYSRLHHIRLCDNPFMKAAQERVQSVFDLDSDGGYYVHLQTKVNHKWASGLVIRTDETYFNSEFELAEAVFEAGFYYAYAVRNLREKLLEEFAFWLPALPEHRTEEKSEANEGIGFAA